MPAGRTEGASLPALRLFRSRSIRGGDFRNGTHLAMAGGKPPPPPPPGGVRTFHQRPPDSSSALQWAGGSRSGWCRRSRPAVRVIVWRDWWLIAPAPDFTLELMEPDLTDAQRASLERDGFYEEPTPLRPRPERIYQSLVRGWSQEQGSGRPDRYGAPRFNIIQGMADPDVPWRHALRLVEHLPSDNVTLTLIRDGDHRLSRDEDIARILGAVDSIRHTDLKWSTARRAARKPGCSK